jgi:hypothetical protein
LGSGLLKGQPKVADTSKIGGFSTIGCPFLFFHGDQMQNRQATVQAPRPEVKIYDPDSDKPKLEFDTAKGHYKGLREYSFRTSVDDVKGQFSLTFYPDDFDGKKPIFDELHELDIVEIYESKNHFKQSEEKVTGEVLPTFTGVIRSKKYASQISGTSVTRKLVVTGHSVAGLAAEFRMNMDTSAQVITEELAAQDNVAKSLTISLLEGNDPLKLKEIIEKIWEEFEKLSTRYGKLSNPKILEILKKWTGDNFFDTDEKITLNYPLGCVFNAKSTQGFFDIVEGIIPYQVYEKFTYMDRNAGEMRIKIRECPFDDTQWEKAKSPCYEIPPRLVKAIDIEQNDNEVYTVFFSYLDGYPVQMQKMIVLAKQNQESKSAPALVHDDDKYSKYGYRPLYVTFIGYSKDEGEEDTTTEENLQKLNQRLMDWYGNLELMYNGQLTMSTDLSMDMPQAGEVIAFLGGEFYVTGAEHRWSYLGNPETILSISRGGDYFGGSFEELKYWGSRKEGGIASLNADDKHPITLRR